MNTMLKTVASLALAAVAVSCVYDDYPEDNTPWKDASSAGKVTLLLNVSTLDTRAPGEDGQTAAIPPFEQVKNLRVVIIGTDYRVRDYGDDAPARTGEPWKVEANYRISQDMALGGDVMGAAAKQLKFPDIAADRKKRIYLFINCEDIDFKLSDGTTCRLSGTGAAEKLFGIGTHQPDAAGTEHPYLTGRLPIDDCTFGWNETSPQSMPYVGVHEIDVPPSSEVLGILNPDSPFREPVYSVGPLYLARVGNRIRFVFKNDTAHADGADATPIAPIDIDVLGWTLSSTAGSSYLMPHLTDDWRRGIGGPTGELTLKGTGFTTDGDPETHPAAEYYGGEWMLWLKQEAEKTQQIGDYDGTLQPDPQYEWLTGYEMPDGVVHSELNHTYPDGGIHLPAPTAADSYKETSVSVPEEGGNAVCFAESRYSPDESTGRQTYRLSLTIRQTNTDGDKTPREQTYTCEALPNCLSLFRNTDLLVTVTFRRLRTDGLRMAVDVVPYGSVELDPVFGLPKD